MKRSINDIFFACSYALDCIEREFVGVTTNHGKRVACISLALAEEFGMSADEKAELAGCAVLHDSALTQFMREISDQGIGVDKDLADRGQLDREIIEDIDEVFSGREK